jgi:hypothetical protein
VRATDEALGEFGVVAALEMVRVEVVIGHSAGEHVVDRGEQEAATAMMAFSVRAGS